MGKQVHTLEKREETVLLDAAGIDRLAALLTQALEQAAVDRKEALRLRLATEDILTMWQRGVEDGSACKFRCMTRWGRTYIELQIPGQRMDPSDADTAESGLLFCSNLMAQAGLAPVYSYRDGMNRLAFYPPKPQRFGPLPQLLLAIAASVVCGLLCIAAPEGVRNAVTGIITPLFNALLGILQTLAGPMIFLSVCCGIVNIGDVQTLGKIGKTVLLRFLAAIYLITGITAMCVVWLFRPENGASATGSSAVAQIYDMLLGVIPSNLISPFLEGNTLQIIFMAICLGAALLVLGEKTCAVRTLFDHANTLIQFLMELVSRYIAAFVFISLLSLMLSQSLNGLSGMAKGLALGIVACLIWPLLYALAASIRMKVSFPMLLRKLLPTYLIALSTASSSATLSTNLETCEKQLGISERIIGFAVPLGQVIFKTGGAVGFFVLALGLAEFYGVAMPLPWIVTGVLVSGMLAIAAPPVPSGSLTCYTVLLTQLGIPAEAVGLAVAGNVILDFFMTACGISCLQSELILASNRLGMLDTDCLKQEV